MKQEKIDKRSLRIPRERIWGTDWTIGEVLWD